MGKHRKIKIQKEDGFNSVLAGMLAGGIESHDPATGTGLHEHLADHVCTQVDALDDDTFDSCMLDWFGLGEDEQDAQDANNTLSEDNDDAESGDVDDDGFEAENWVS